MSTRTRSRNGSDVIVEHARPRDLKITDPRYGLKAAAKVAYDVARHERFHAERVAALTAQRCGVQARLANLRKEILGLMGDLKSGKITNPVEVEETFAKLTRLGVVEVKMVQDIARITAKMGDN